MTLIWVLDRANHPATDVADRVRSVVAGYFGVDRAALGQNHVTQALRAASAGSDTQTLLR